MQKTRWRENYQVTPSAGALSLKSKAVSNISRRRRYQKEKRMSWQTVREALKSEYFMNVLQALAKETDPERSLFIAKQMLMVEEPWNERLRLAKSAQEIFEALHQSVCEPVEINTESIAPQTITQQEEPLAPDYKAYLEGADLRN
jgi:hypothetical protein